MKFERTCFRKSIQRVWRLNMFLGMFLGSFLVAGCGVKGKPLPPLEPAEIGRGAPTYKRSAEQAKPTTIPDADAPSTSSPKLQPSPTPDRRGQ